MKSRNGKSQRREEQKKEDQKRESLKKEGPGVRKGRKAARHCVFSNDLWLRRVEK
jgi:ribosomal protein L19E